MVAIEPQPGCAAQITAFYEMGLPRGNPRRGALDLHIEALGNESGSATLYVPMKDGRVDDESASLKPGDGDMMRIDVPVRRLDDYALDNVKVIKMDVEGRELQALEGASATIRRWQPSLLVEIEQRHHDENISDIFSRIDEIIGSGYRTSFLGSNNRFRPLSEFNVERDQLALRDNPLSRAYVRNFFFLPG